MQVNIFEGSRRIAKVACVGFLSSCTALSMTPATAHSDNERQDWPAALVCEFQSYAFAESGVGDHAPAFSVEMKSGGMDPITFASINLQSLSAQMIGNAGASNVQLIVGVHALTFIEVTPVGNVNTTAVSNYEEPELGVFRVVHSRFVNILGDVLASQYYGLCHARW